MPITSYAELQTYMTNLFRGLVSQSTGNNELQDTSDDSPHGVFWNTLTYDQFVHGPVPHVKDPTTGNPMPILVPGRSAQSNLIMAMRGQGVFSPTTGAIPQMPADGPPFPTDAQIQPIADWIDAGCPK
ncbi:MAG: hypothetical protein ABSC94_14945 [Polyangiaceae bacterium]